MTIIQPKCQMYSGDARKCRDCGGGDTKLPCYKA